MLFKKFANQIKYWINDQNRLMESQLQDNDTENCSIGNERKSGVAERFIRTLKTKIYTYMTLISKNVYIDKLDGIVNK